MSLASQNQRTYESQHFEGLVCDRSEVCLKQFTGCTFENCTFQETVLRECRFVDCTFVKCRLIMGHIADCDFKSVFFKDSNLIGINWAASKIARAVPPGQWGDNAVKIAFLRPIDFLNCVLNHSGFVGLQLRGISMIQCSAKDVDFADADLSKGNFQHTDFSDSRFLNTNLTEADFRYAKNYLINVSINKLKKTRFALPEALVLLHGLDIILEE